MELVERYLHGLFPQWGIRFIAVVDNIDTSVKGNKKARQISGLINEWYLEDLSENIKAVFEAKRKDGQYIGSFPVYGYKKDPQNHNHLVIDEEAAEVVRRIFSQYIAGMGKQQIAAKLNGEGIPNPTLYKQSKGLFYCGAGGKAGSGLWSKTTVGRILKNEMYTGTLVQGKKRKVSYKSKQCADVPEEQWVRVPGTHGAVIERALFDSAQGQLRGYTRSGGEGERHALSGLVHCMDCGSALCRTSCSRKGVRLSYLRCGRYASSSSACSSHSIRLDALMEIIEEKIRSHVAALGTEALTALIRDDTGEAGQAFQTKTDALQRQIDLRRAAIKKLYLDRAAGLITDGRFAEYSGSFEAEIGELKRRQEKLLPEPDPVRDGAEGQQKALSLLQLRTVPKTLVRLLIQNIEVSQKDAATGEQLIRIHWRF